MSRPCWFSDHPSTCTCAVCNEVKLASGDNRLRRQNRATGDDEVNGYGRFWKIKYPLPSLKALTELEETLEKERVKVVL